MNIRPLFGAYCNEFLRFDRVENKRTQRADLHAFMLLDSVLPASQDIVVYSRHDEITLSPGIDDLEAAGITEEQVVELIRCGVRYDEDGDCLVMFV